MHKDFKKCLVEEFEERFWSKVRKSPDGCWEWTACLLPKGYGQFKFGKGMVKAHRVSYEMAHGRIPPGMLCLHTCDNPPCVNPAHLRIGTNAENMAEMAAKQRARHGSKHPCATLTEDTVSAIKRELEKGRTVLDVAAQFKVGRTNVWLIRERRAWKHVK